jgi:catechol 2,3-dioxygenase-like lactoylglutathione lyase family enzyme
MKRTQVQGVHHITLVGSTKPSAIDFWEGALGMPFIFEQPNLGKPSENHLYFDPGDGRLLTVFTDESRQDAARPAPRLMRGPGDRRCPITTEIAQAARHPQND